MIPTYVFGWPTGEEKGEFLAVDLGMCLRFEPFCAASHPSWAPRLVRVERWNEPTCVPRHSAWQRQVRDHPIKVSSFGRTKAGRRPKAVRLLRRMPQDVHRHQS